MSRLRELQQDFLSTEVEREEKKAVLVDYIIERIVSKNRKLQDKLDYDRLKNIVVETFNANQQKMLTADEKTLDVLIIGFIYEYFTQEETVKYSTQYHLQPSDIVEAGNGIFQVIDIVEGGDVLVVIDLDDLRENREDKDLWEDSVSNIYSKEKWIEMHGDKWNFAI
ncbi:MAG: hypothetical protein ACOCQR_03455 [bacterium]